MYILSVNFGTYRAPYHIYIKCKALYIPIYTDIPIKYRARAL